MHPGSRESDGSDDANGLAPASYTQIAREAAPRVQAALDGKVSLGPQPPLTEAWITYALLMDDEPEALEEVMFWADAIRHLLPEPDEIGWALVQLRSRGWLAMTDDSYSLTAEARSLVREIVHGAEVWEGVERLDRWVLAHPPPGDDESGQLPPVGD
jgi:hypothetical protein